MYKRQQPRQAVIFSSLYCMIMLALYIFSSLSPSILTNFISLPKAMAQVTKSSNLSTYENPAYTFRIQYPS
ncbi:MAG TPA: hypothetical protein VIP56_13295, partial [Nitrososphaeraceae archaeon]